MNDHIIYFADKTLVITAEALPEEVTPERAVHQAWPSSTITRAKILQFFEKSNSLWLITPNPDDCFEHILREFTWVEAAGGAVRNPEGEILMIYRNNRWDLPKGHHEQGETIEECALREVEEETSITGLTLGRLLVVTLHAYCLRGHWEVKQTHWFEMSTRELQSPSPQVEEGITRVEWLPVEEAVSCARKSFPTIQRVLEQLLDKPQA